jgi:hypothetical protein
LHMNNMIPLLGLSHFRHCCIRLHLWFQTIWAVRALSLTTFKILGFECYLICIKLPIICELFKFLTKLLPVERAGTEIYQNVHSNIQQNLEDSILGIGGDKVMVKVTVPKWSYQH